MIQSPACYSGALFSIVEDEQKKIRGRVSSRVSSCLTMPKGVLCKFFVHGACLKGEYCEFSHDWKDQPNNVCTFYQKGVCIYGARCRYDHVKVSRSSSSISSSSSILCSSSITHPSSSASKGETVNLSGAPVELSALSKPFSPSSRPAWNQGFIDFAIPENGFDGNSTASRTADQPICAFAAGGRCPNGDNCPQMHGDLCSTCGKHCLHPYRPDEREEHINQCQINKKRLEALRHSQEIECSVCLERVLSKGTPAERKFGILSECDHPFCISCIRNWRSNSPSSGMDVNTALRACPICRKLSYFVIPSVIWYSSKEEKQEILDSYKNKLRNWRSNSPSSGTDVNTALRACPICRKLLYFVILSVIWYSSKEEKQEILDSYKNKLRSIDCKHFDFGNGRCPFGTSCFYKHTYRPRPRPAWWEDEEDEEDEEEKEPLDLDDEDDDDDLDALSAHMAFLLMLSGLPGWSDEDD